MAQLKKPRVTKEPTKVRIASENQFDAKQYEISEKFEKMSKPHTVHEMVEAIERGSEVDGLFLCANSKGEFKYKRIKDRQEFLEAFKKGGAGAKLPSRMKEATDLFGTDQDSPSTGLVGDDYTPLMGGPFSKQMYMYDALKMYALSFQAYHHDPFARAIVHITRDFTLGRGFRVDSENKAALSYWRAFEEANGLQQWFETAAVELSLYGELLVWWLPNNETKITYKLKPGDKPPKGLIPRIRLIDPSTCWEIVTYPEDITRVLYYKLVFPTQYQMYTAPNAPGSKFIIQDIPADQVQHHKINCVSNEKRGRSDLFPALGYLKRLRDSVNYSIIAMQKAAAWAIDTTIEGSQSDLDAYVSSQQAAGTIAPAGSEFVHTAKITRQYLSNTASAGKTGNVAFEWCLNMVCASVQIPMNYFGTHISGGSTRASALVATEPVAKKFENRQQVYERILKGMWRKLMESAGIDADCEVTFPEVIVQDRSAKIKDIKIAEDCGYISKERAATMASKELGITEFEYDEEKQIIDNEGLGPMLPNLIAPLTSPGAATAKPGTPGSGAGPVKPDAKPTSAVPSSEKKSVMDKR